MGVLVLGAVGVLKERTSVWLALGVGVLVLVVQGIRYARVERLGRSGTAAAVAANLALGLGALPTPLMVGAAPMSLIVVVPCYNEAARLRPAGFAPLLEREGVGILFVDDGSTDETRRALEALAALHPTRIDVLVLEVEPHCLGLRVVYLRHPRLLWTFLREI